MINHQHFHSAQNCRYSAANDPSSPHNNFISPRVNRHIRTIVLSSKQALCGAASRWKSIRIKVSERIRRSRVVWQCVQDKRSSSQSTRTRTKSGKQRPTARLQTRTVQKRGIRNTRPHAHASLYTVINRFSERRSGAVRQTGALA